MGMGLGELWRTCARIGQALTALTVGSIAGDNIGSVQGKYPF